jgi:hypothetical protein
MQAVLTAVLMGTANRVRGRSTWTEIQCFCTAEIAGLTDHSRLQYLLCIQNGEFPKNPNLVSPLP